MLDKLLENLKKKLPGAKKVDEQEIQEELEEEISEKGEEVEKAVAKKSSPLIKIILVLAIGYFAYDFLMPQEEELSVDQMVAQSAKPKRKRPVKEREEAATQSEEVKKEGEEVLASNPSEKPLETTPESTVANTPETEAPPVTDESASNAISQIETPPVTEPTPEPQPQPEPTPDLAQAPVENINITAPVVNDPGLGETKNLNQAQAVDPGITNNTPAVDLTTKINEEAPYVAPPKYDVPGRGLVYNCTGKHWACIDKANYQICHLNMKWNTDNSKAKECVTQNVYASEEDCNKVQNYNVSFNRAEICK